MSIRVVVHLHNEEPFVAEMEEMPDPKDNFVVLRNPRSRDGRSLTFVTDGATAFLYPWTRITFIEIIDGAGSQESIVGFFREDSRANRP
ncbi:hypothetical protein [Sphaerobacter thermophilus]|jgi:hypothetical protein|uniref:Uncharacterized protein n=1 Tax=Sphaerobacter thermophilus (strain ATCC 49802 / DSM 20745 / KCCM 41009 / NCIMB 13125 / S 6022) TaxID=479434 RepID=D1C365_SPHTD|nr:hypothetical protein [Sphaerobacter thermophilus]ACZ38682.1 conserved hypothetical protein [Sphaerobacter thermophilus DSM 20745]PZN65784.1 MAG: hypothetical protein DIU58_06620 [Sphaerobacter thermophilus]